MWPQKTEHVAEVGGAEDECDAEVEAARVDGAGEEILEHHADDAAVDRAEGDRQQRPGEQLGSESAI